MFSSESLSVPILREFIRFGPFESSSNVPHIKKSGHFDINVVLKSQLVRVGKSGNYVRN